ncbi:MAG: hypothetical protein Fur0012_02300 [Elusimicrobiota bacterium]
MKKIYLSIALMVLSVFNLKAQENFNLERVDASTILSSSQIEIPAIGMDEAPLNRAPNLKPALDISLKLPFSEINKRLAEINPSLLKATSSLPILSRKGDFLAFENVSVNYGGVEVEPSIFLKPYFISRNKLALKIQKIEADIAFGPSRSFNQIDKNALVEKAVSGIMESVLKSMDEALAKNKVGLKAKDLLSWSYDRTSWTVYFDINPSFISPLLPGIVSSLNLNSFGFDESGFYLKAGFNSELIALNPYYNLAVSDGLLTAFVKKYSQGGDIDISPADYDGGFKFQQDGLTELAARAKVSSLPFKPNVYFKVWLRITLSAENTVKVRIEKIDVDKAYGLGILGSVISWFQGKLTSSAVDAIVSNPELNKAMKAKKIDDKTIELNFANSAFLPSFARGMKIKGLAVSKGLCYLGFEF